MSSRRCFLPVLTAAALLTSPAFAAGGGKAKKGGGGAHVDLAQMALPVIVDGKIKNYVFIELRLKPSGGADISKLRAAEPFYRDSLIRAAHRTSFSPPGDWTRLDERRVEAFILAEARRISGPKAFVAAEVVRQTPRKRTGMRSGPAPR